MHPLQFGFVRRKVRAQRRHGMPIVNPVIFYPWRAYDFVSSALRWLKLVRHYKGMMKRITADAATSTYIDEALMPIEAGHQDHFVEAFADQIPKTHGAPVRAERAREVVAAE